MVQLKLTLKSNRPSVVYSTNGKSYKLQPGSNTLNLEYEDYVALATALSIKPVANKPEPPQQPTEETPRQEPAEAPKQGPENVEEPNSLTNESEIKSQDNKSSDDNVDSNEEPAEDEAEPEEPDETLSESNEVSSVVDYSQLSYTELKAKYKEITGKSCKLKKDELISFLQEHSDNAE